MVRRLERYNGLPSMEILGQAAPGKYWWLDGDDGGTGKQAAVRALDMTGPGSYRERLSAAGPLPYVCISPDRRLPVSGGLYELVYPVLRNAGCSAWGYRRAAGCDLPQTD